MHEWNDDWDKKYGHQLNEAVSWIPTQLKRWGRYPLTSAKEKYGTLRLEWLGCTHRGLYGLFFPGRIQFPKKGPKIYRKYSKNMLKYMKEPGRYVNLYYQLNIWSEDISCKIGLRRLWNAYQHLVLNLVFLRACYKWPEVRKEITNDLDHEVFYKWTAKLMKYRCMWSCCKKVYKR